jgi:choline dehydrogenase-like flavoprotein
MNIPVCAGGSAVPGTEIPNPGSAASPAVAPALAFDFEAIVVGTGFGGAVTACRLAQAGLKILILERGRRYALTDLPALPQGTEFLPEPRRWTWGGSQGLWDIRNLDGVTVAQSAAYGGGSLVYANVHLRPPKEVFTKAWPDDCYHRTKKLDDYFDLAAYMLRVAPIPVPWRGIGKTGAMSTAFRKAAVQATDVFFPPLAIQFPQDAAETPPAPPDPPLDESDPALRPNIYGMPQGPCQRCGACDFGCRYGAKNTLDRNYLALAEQTGNVTVRTLAEALMISPFQGGYRVDFHDHLTETRHQVTARYLFLCAGAVNTTELLLRSTKQGAKDGLPDPTLGPGLSKEIAGLGNDYFVNADALAMVLDTKVPIDPSGGPVITTALIHKQQTPARQLRRRPLLRKCKPGQVDSLLERREWFMIQDGGYAKEMARFYATSGSPLLFGRNRFDPGGPLPNLFAPGGLAPTARPDRYMSFLAGAFAALREKTLPDLLPENFRQAWDGLTKNVREWWHELLGDVAEAVRNEVIYTSGLGRLFRRTGLYRFGVFRRFLWCLSLFLMGANRDHLLQNVIDVGAHRMGADDPASIPARVGRLLLGEGYPLEDPEHGPPLGSTPPTQRPAENRTLLLAMGRDDAPATISIDETTDRLRVAFQDDAFPTLGDEERVMRDVATALEGTLRSSPLWAFARQPITAHSHGGCALGYVTDIYGQLPNYPNLYINDGSLLPGPVGVNPSATIAAIAERNMEHFVREVLGRDAIPWQQTKDDALHWVSAQKDADVVFEPPDPSKVRVRDLVPRPTPENATNAEAAPPHSPIGVTFKELMSGYLSHVDDQAGLLPDPLRARVPQPPFLVGEGQARALAAASPPTAGAKFDCTSRLLDIGAFLDDPNHVMGLEGTITIPEGVLSAGSPAVEVGNVVGQLHLLADTGAVRRVMTYYLPFSAPQGQRYTLVGHKEVEDDPGFDAWLDTATLFTEIYRGEVTPLPPSETDLKARDVRRRALSTSAYQGTVVARGILRLGMTDFLTNQLQELAAAGTDDPARVIWTLGSFGVYFFGTIQKAYSSQIERFLDLFSRSGWRTQPAANALSHRPKTLGLMKGL